MARFYATTTVGLEDVAAAELTRLGAIVEGESDVGGVAFSAPRKLAMEAHLRCRTVNRIVMRFGAFSATTRAELTAASRDLPWHDVLRDGPVEIVANSKKSRLHHTGLIAEAVEASFPTSRARAPEKLSQRVDVRLVRDRVVVSVDMTGDSLYRRGYRTHVGDAPIRETTAAAALQWAERRRDTPVVDPMAGAGTFVIESVLSDVEPLPGRGRSFAFEHWPCVEGWGGQRAELEKTEVRRDSPARYQGVDRDAKAVEAARHNAQMASVRDRTSFEVGQFFSVRPQGESGLVVCNPPWGKRLGTRDKLRTLWENLGRIYRRFDGWTGLVVSGDRQLSNAFRRGLGRKPDDTRGIRVGGQAVELLRFVCGA